MTEDGVSESATMKRRVVSVELLYVDIIMFWGCTGSPKVGSCN